LVCRWGRANSPQRTSHVARSIGPTFSDTSRNITWAEKYVVVSLGSVPHSVTGRTKTRPGTVRGGAWAWGICARPVRQLFRWRWNLNGCRGKCTGGISQFPPEDLVWVPGCRRICCPEPTNVVSDPPGRLLVVSFSSEKLDLFFWFSLSRFGRLPRLPPRDSARTT